MSATLRLLAPLCAAAALALAAPPPPRLTMAQCSATDPAQLFLVAGGAVVHVASSLCVAFDGTSYNDALVLLPCDPASNAQAWESADGGRALSNPAGRCGGLSGACIQWSGQESALCTSNPPALGPNCTWGTWGTSLPTTWNNAVLLDEPGPGNVQSLFLSAAGPSPSGVCASVFTPPPPVPPTPEILAWADKEVGCLIDYSMCTMVGSQGCSCSEAPPPADAWEPTALDTDSWIEAGAAGGCTYFIFVAKHVCGFLSWNSTSAAGYDYSSAYSSTPVDAVAAFRASAKKYSVPIGFYYSVNDNSRAAFCGGRPTGTPQPGQLNMTVAEYDDIVITHLTELWGGGDPLFEVWFDGGVSSSLSSRIVPLFKQLQPGTVAFQGQTLMPNPTRWIGSESGYAPYPTWSTCDLDAYGAGSPDSPSWFPAETDFTVLDGDTWFFDPAKPVRAPAVLRAMYDASVGHNTNALIGLGVPPNGTMRGTEQERALKTLGDYISNCYTGALIVSAANRADVTITLSPSAPALVGRVVVQEDQTRGQLVRGFTVTALLSDGSTVTLDSGPSVGHKKIGVVRPAVAGVVSVTLNITAATAPPVVRFFGVYGDCDSL
jgi:alpha-L-fucosidase